MKYGLLGEHLPHSYSPLIHSMLGDYEYSLIEKAPHQVEDFIKNGDFKGINVTIPYKKTVIPYLDCLSTRAQRIGSVNVVVRRDDGTLFGDNSDYGGFLSLVKASGIRIAGKKVLVLGSGGASLTVQAVLSDLNAGSVIVISRSGEDNYENISKHSDADVIVNTTPVGMYPNCGESPVSLSAFTKLSGVLDLIYNPQKTALILEAERRKVKAMGGLHMLVAQAVLASGMFFNKRMDERLISTVEKKVAAMMKNVTLIGMPGCGKSTIGKRLAALTGRRFVDIDAEIVKHAGKTIPEIFASEGEDEFRRLETLVTEKFTKESGCIISCGGGIVTREENRDLLRQNSTVVFISRNIEMLATKGRPLSATSSAEDLWKQRGPMYKAWSDVKILNLGINPTAVAIAKTLHLNLKKREKIDETSDNKRPKS
ncbi:MAG: shikimate kinase [Clostridia bacterium]|nr:shikimate kinase [Clostridia bacterium]